MVDQLRDSGKVNWSWTGLQLQPLKDFNRNIYFDGTRGRDRRRHRPGQPARHAGIQPRDRILKVNGQPSRRSPRKTCRTSAACSACCREASRRRWIFCAARHRRCTRRLDAARKGQGRGRGARLPALGPAPSRRSTSSTTRTCSSSSKQGVFVFGIKYPGQRRQRRPAAARTSCSRSTRQDGQHARRTGDESTRRR